MLLLLYRTDRAEEIAAEPDTLRQFGVLLDRARTERAREGRVLSGGRGLLALPRVPDPHIPPGTVILRPHPTPGLTP